jgi:hypothetical protein
MSWLQFIDSMTGRLAWPIVIIVLVVILRKQVISLAERIEKVTFPGGSAKFKEFEKELTRAVNHAAKVSGRYRFVEPRVDEKDLQLTKTSPVAAISLAYHEVEQAVMRLASVLNVKAANNSILLAQRLLRLGYIDLDMFEIFDGLRRARNAVLHDDTRNPTEAQAVSYLHQSQILTDALARISSDRLGQKNR